MPKIVIVYDSKTGNTERMAKAVAEGASTVKGVEVELNKIGTRFPISSLERADAIVFGSPTIYGNLTPEMRTFIDSLMELKSAKKLRLENKIGGAFGSYGWDGGWVVDSIQKRMEKLGIMVLSPPISAVDQSGSFGIHIDESSLQNCRNLGKTIAEKLIKP